MRLCQCRRPRTPDSDGPGCGPEMGPLARQNCRVRQRFVASAFRVGEPMLLSVTRTRNQRTVVFCNRWTNVAICEPTDRDRDRDYTFICSLRNVNLNLKFSRERVEASSCHRDRDGRFFAHSESTLGDLARGTARSIAPTAQNWS
jgi:hypothetical protein